jgi:methylmalonyl-CoA mutase
VPGADAVELPAKALATKAEGNRWSLTESIQQTSDVMPALMGGAEGIRFRDERCTWEWLNGVHLEMIYLHLDADCIELAGFPFKQMREAGWKGSCTRNLSTVTAEVVRHHADAFVALPSVRKWAIDTCDAADPVAALCSGLVQAHGAWNAFEAVGLEKAAERESFVWRHQMHPHVLEGVAMTRAMRILWQRWLKSRGQAPASIWLDARTYRPDVGEGLSTDRLIGMTSAAYASALGGPDSLEVLPHDSGDGMASSEGKRWARNIQHLMREEAGLHRVFDPMGGSRVVEAWTASMVEAAWDAFEKRVQS